jgi:hypothetical protein
LTYGERVSPILVRPIREQFEHNRVIRLLAPRFRRKFTVGVNIGDEPEATGVRSGTGLVYPDLVLTSSEGVRRVHGIVEVETTESVNHLEAMTEWVSFGKVRGAFYLYVPAGATDVARRLCEESHVSFTEIWSYHAVGDQMRFTMAHRSARAAAAGRRELKAAKLAAAAAAPTAKRDRTVKKPAERTKKPAAKRARSAPKAARKPAASKAKAKAAASKAARKSTAVKRSTPRSTTAKAVTRVKKRSGTRATKPKPTPSAGRAGKKKARSVKAVARPAKAGAKKTTARSRTRR